MSADAFPDGSLATSIYGYPTKNDDDELAFVMSYLVGIELPDTDAAENFETDVIDLVLDNADEWKSKGVNFRVEIESYRSFEDE